MIDYETFCKIHDCHHRQGLTIAQTARLLGVHPRTVATWLARARFTQRRSRPRPSKLDPFKPSITRLLDTHPYSAQQIFQRLREEGYRGGISILRDYVRRIRPPQRPVYLKLHFSRGECAQVDWGAFGSIAVGNTRRRLSFFVMVLAFSRQMYVEFTVSQTMEHFLACHEHAFRAFGGVPIKVMVDFVSGNIIDPGLNRFAVVTRGNLKVPSGDLPAFPMKFDCETMEALLAAFSYRKGASHDCSSTTDDRGHAGTESVTAYTGIVSATGIAVRTSLRQVA